ncbi:MAG: amino-acid N-acetyltransferase [Gammaproteobacteria bacterium]|nr:amino-acid N-acetyltransferase [Gammaproteobacteria bacterium]MDE0271001.1 amino-acid N-acetyltransferase [Gammaproteobacteria bacterium]
MNTQDYARWFRASTPYISAHRQQTFVVLLPGEALAHPNLVNVVHDLALLHVLGVRLVIVHGARPQINAALSDSRSACRMETHDGVARRITDPDAMQAIAGVYGQLRTELEALFSTGVPTSPLHNAEIQIAGGNFITARPIGVLDGVDYQLTGRPRRVQAHRLNAMLDAGAIVLLSPIGYSPSGQPFNLAADELAGEVAVALKARKLIAFDRQPYLADADGQRLGNLSPASASAMLESGSVDEATGRHLATLAQAVAGGVASGQLVSHEDDGALLAELFTAEGVGTQITEDDRRTVRRAEPRDVADIVEVIRPLEEAGVLVKRSRDRLEREVERFLVAEVDGFVIGCCALYPAGSSVELACVAVHPAHRSMAGSGAGARLLAAAEDAARAEGFERMFALTTQTRDWFVEQGFEEGSLEDLPAPKQTLYNHARGAKVLVKALI